MVEQSLFQPRLDHVGVDPGLAAHDRQYAAVEPRAVEQTRSRAQPPRLLNPIHTDDPVGRRRPRSIPSVLLHVPFLFDLKSSSHRKRDEQSVACTYLLFQSLG